MKPLFKGILAIALLAIAAATPALAYDHIQYDDSYWPRSYYVNAAFGTFFTWGDVNERPITVTDSIDEKHKIYTPDMAVFPSPEITLGVNIRSFSLDVNFQYWKTSQDLVDIDASEDATIWRVGFEFTYNLFWPEDFQVGVGLGYSYTSLTTENAAFIGEKIQDSHLMGSGIALVTNVHYYLTDNFAIVPAVKLYENWFKFVNSKATGTCDLEPFLWQTYVFASVGVQYQF
jgi:hypothetical protein